MKFTTLRHIKTFGLAVALMCFIGAQQAAAQKSIFKDPDTGLSLSYPESWQQINDYAPDDIVTLIAPGQNEAICRVRVREDKRFDVYPAKYSAAIQKHAYSLEFWNDYLSSFDDIAIHTLDDTRGLAEAFASTVTASYVTTHPQRGRVKTSLISAGLYNGQAYIFDCSVNAESYAQFHPQFQDIMSSVAMKKVIATRLEGKNKDLQKGPAIVVPVGKNGPTKTY